METSLKTGFAQIYSCCPKTLSCPKFGGAAAPLAPPARTPMKKGTRYNNFSYELTVFGFFGSLQAKGQGCIQGIPNTMYLRQFYSILPFF